MHLITKEQLFKEHAPNHKATKRVSAVKTSHNLIISKTNLARRHVDH